MGSFRDLTGFVNCPYCGSIDKMHYIVIPQSERKFWRDGEEHVEFWDESRDYKCGNCDFEFSTLMREEDYA